MKLPDNDRIILTAQRMLEAEYKPVIIYPKGFERSPNNRTTGKEPFGKAWGEKQVTFETIESDVSYFDRLGSVAGVGILLGPGRAPHGKALADLDGDGVTAEDSFARLFAGEVLDSIGHFSERGRHLFIAYDYERVKAILKRLVKAGCQSKQRNQSGVFHLPQLPDLELRLGGFHDNGKIKQLQSVIPPTPGTLGVPRTWNGIKTLADAPEAFYAFLEHAADEIAQQQAGTGTAGMAGNGIGKPSGDRAGRYLIAALERTVGRIATAPVGERHAMLMSQAASLARYLHYGHGFTEQDLEAAMLAGANQAAPERTANGENLRAVRDAITFGKTIPKNLPDELHAIATAPPEPDDKVTFESAPESHANGQATNGQAKQKPGTPPDFRAMSRADLGLISFRDIVSRPLVWIWKHRLKAGSMALLGGMGGEGKSTILLKLAALVTTGGAWPDGEGSAPLGNVIILSAEDNPEDTLKPRFVAMGGDVDRIELLRAKYILHGLVSNPKLRPTSLQDLDWWDGLIHQTPDLKLLIVDPLPSYLGRGVNDSKNAEIRQVIEPFLHRVIEPSGVCMLCNTHFNKSVDIKTPVHRITGSHAYGDIPRNVHVAVSDPDDRHKRYFKQVKCNNAPPDLGALVYKLEQVQIPADSGGLVETTKLTFETKLEDIDMEEMMARQKEKKKPLPKLKTQECAVWLLGWLRERQDAQHFAAVINAAGEAGYAGALKDDGRWSNPQILYRAKDALPRLASPDDGWEVRESERGIGRNGKPIPYWHLARMDGAAPAGAGDDGRNRNREPGDDDPDDDNVPF